MTTRPSTTISARRSGASPPAGTPLDDLEKSLFGGTAGRGGTGGCSASTRPSRVRRRWRWCNRRWQENDPYVLAFVDIRMPPGWDGVETLEHLWECWPELQAVICTAYSDYSWDDMTRRLGQTDSLLILKKPFDTAEVLQVAHALTRKWSLARQAKLRMEDLDRMVRERTQKLQQEIEERARGFRKPCASRKSAFRRRFWPAPCRWRFRAMRMAVFWTPIPASCSSRAIRPSSYPAHRARKCASGNDRPAQPPERASPKSASATSACVLRRGDGTTRDTVVWAEPITLEAGPCRLVIVEDMTERLKLEGAVAPGAEAGGGRVPGRRHRARVQQPADGDPGPYGFAGRQTAGDAAPPRNPSPASPRRASAPRRSTRRLLAFSHKQPVQFKPIELSAAVQGLTKMLGQLIGEPYQLRLDCAR